MRWRPNLLDATLAGWGLLGGVATLATSFGVNPYEARGPTNAPLFTYAAAIAFALPVAGAAWRMAGTTRPTLPGGRSWGEAIIVLSAFCAANLVLIRAVGEGSTGGLVVGLVACAGLFIVARRLEGEGRPLTRG